MKYIKKIIKLFIFVILISLTAGLGIYGYQHISPKLEIKSANNISLYDNTGVLYFQGSGTNEWVSLNSISKNVINATISTEDKNFYKHFGFDFARILKAGYANILAGKTMQGASTISQQYVKNLFLNFDKTWERKWNELWLTLNIESHYSKDEILEGYLNTINYGHGMYGIANAADYYFNKKAQDLTLAEASLLVGIPKSPSNYSPLINYELSKKRQKIILNGMVKNGYISTEEMKKAYNEELTIVGKKATINSDTILYFQDAVLNELKTITSIPSSFLDTGGLKIYTTLNWEAQNALEQSIKENLKNKDELQTSSVMINSKTGEIIALVGGRDFSTSQYNRAIKSTRQVGSTMKPFLYYAALENGFTSSTSFTSEETTFAFSNQDSYSPKNANEIYGHKPISLAAAIAYSENIYAIKTHMFLGEDALVNMAKRLGITTKLPEIPSLPLGTSEIGIIEMASAYSVFANNGYKNKPHLITKIEDINGNVLYEFKETEELVLNPSLTYILNELLTSTYDSTFIDYNYPTIINVAGRLSRKYSVKSGTTATDGWTIGYNPDVVTAVWVGYDNSKEIDKSIYPISKNIWADTMENYLKDKEKTWFEMPSNVVGVLVDPISGKPATSTSAKKKVLYYLKGTEPTGEEMVFDEKLED